MKESERLALEAARLAAEAKKQAAQDSIADLTRRQEAAQKAYADSMAAAKEAERVERIRVKEAEEKAAAEAIQKKKEEEEAAKQAEIARVREQRKVNSLRETTEEEAGRVTVTTYTDIYGVKATYKRVIQSWGETYYYKGAAIITEALYRTELDAARTEVNPENAVTE